MEKLIDVDLLIDFERFRKGLKDKNLPSDAVIKLYVIATMNPGEEAMDKYYEVGRNTLTGQISEELGTLVALKDLVLHSKKDFDENAKRLIIEQAELADKKMKSLYEKLAKVDR